MSHSLRLAVGTVQREADSQVMTWALMGAMRQLGLDVQHFYGQSCLACVDGAASITGSGSRHLDSWLMSPETCRQLFSHATQAADIAIVEGCYRFALPTACRAGGTLEQLCDWLALPRIVILDVGQLSDCRLPELPPGAEALLLDRVRGTRGLVQEQTRLEALYGLPVLGALPGLVHARRGIARLAPGAAPAASICRELGTVFKRHASLLRLLDLANRPDLRVGPAKTALRRQAHPAVRIAVAYDAAFNSYFHDTLDQLELCGAEIKTFSPLKDAALPPCDIVYLGAGRPDQFAEQLAANQCILSSLRSHYCRGGRIYAEGGGLAYLCQAVAAPNGSRHLMVGAVPAIARATEHVAGEPLEVTLAQDTWLAKAGSRIRGYAKAQWQLEFSSSLAPAVIEPQHQAKLIAMRGLIGSLMHINFAAQPCLLARFFDPWPTAPQPAIAL
jgi:cobyrinic acid a,c-diamide synthase